MTRAPARQVRPGVGDARREGLIARPRPERRLDEVFGKRLGTVVAGPGFGKTTLLDTWRRDVDSAWHTLTPRDESVARLARSLAEAVDIRFPALEPSQWYGSMPDAASADIERADSFAGLLCERLERALEHDLVLVLDDVHELGEGSGGARVVESVCRHAPPLLHLVLSSRAAPPFPVQRLRGRGEVLELTSADLAFTAEEVIALAGATLGEETSRRLHESSGGWPAAVRLALEVARGTEPARREAVVKRLAHPDAPLYAYLAEEVLARDPPEARDLLRRTAALDRVSPALCLRLGLPGGEATLRELVRRGLAAAQDDGWFSVHALVRDFAARAWPLREDEAREVHRAAAAWFEEEGCHEEALLLLAASGDRDETRRLLTSRGHEIVAGGGAGSVIRAGDLDVRRPVEPAIDEVLGEAYAVRGESDRALEHLWRAARGRSRLPASLAWRLVAALHLKGDLGEARRVVERARLDDADPFDQILLFAWAAAVMRRLGDLGESGRFAAEALAAAGRGGDDRGSALAHAELALSCERHGSERDEQLDRALAAAERSGDVFQGARIRNSRGSMLLEVGEYGEAVEELNRAIELAELGGFTSLVALATMNRGLCRYCLGQLAEARTDYESAFGLYRSTGSREAAYAVIGRGDVHRERGDGELARAAYEEGLALAEQSGDRQALVPALYQLAKVLVDDDPERAARLAERAVEYGWPDLPWALNAVGWVALVGGDRDAAAGAARRAARAARELHDPYGLAESLELDAMATTDPARARRALEEALTVWRRLPNAVHEALVELALARLTKASGSHRREVRAERQLRRLGVQVRAAAPAGLLRFVAERGLIPVSVETLGSFRVLRPGDAVAPREWRSQKAQDLLKILVSRRGAETPRELLMEALWPDEEPSLLRNRLSVALSTMRSLLDPGRDYDGNHFVAADLRSVSLDLSHVVVDVEDFLSEAAEGLRLRREGAPQAGERLEHAFALYRGDFLPADAYEEWSVSLREEARALYVEVAHVLAAAADAEERHDEAARFCLRILERDAYDERAHLRLARALLAAARHGDARRQYRRYCRRMDEIGIEPAPFPVLSAA
jgi:DNA-binding SARP family transcriptional activator/tetratricopeptide (TPR) repeat protein